MKNFKQANFSICSIFFFCSCIFAYSGGTGEPNNPYQISNVTDLQQLMNTYTDWDKNFLLTADVNLAEITLIPIGNSITNFTGAFDGNNHVIKNAFINNPTIPDGVYTGIFGYLGTSGKILNLGAENINLIGSYYVGGLAGYNCGTITSCHTTGFVSGNDHVGGLVGKNSSGSVISCYANASVSGWNYVGGLIGSSQNDSSFLICSHAAGVVNGQDYIGGSVGDNLSIIISCYTTATVTGHYYVGGFAARNGGWITSCYAAGNVNASCFVGGFVGYNEVGSITHSYSNGYVTGESSTGGFIGLDNGGSIYSCFWDTQTSGQISSVGGIGKTTDEMKNLAAFLNDGWDFVAESTNGLHDFWQIAPNQYPNLAAQSWTLSGVGTALNPYLIQNASDLSKVWLKPYDCYHLNSDLDLSSISWSTAIIPIFFGVFDGSDFALRNILINQPNSDFIGTFGYVGKSSQIRNLSAQNVNITGYDFVGGLVGQNSDGTITSCCSNGSVIGQMEVGGLIGSDINGSVTLSCSKGQISGFANVGGLVGHAAFGSINSCFATNSVNGTFEVGGLVGNSDSSITSCYATGSVSGYDHIGGLVGLNYSSIISSYAAGNVTGEYHLGGLVGYNDNGSILSSFWDTQSTGQQESQGGLGKTAAEMKMQFTFPDWDFSNTDGDPAEWIMLRPDEDYPRLVWQKILQGDIAGLYAVDYFDLAELAEHWLQSGCPTNCEDADIDGSGSVDFKDFAPFASDWLNGT